MTLNPLSYITDMIWNTQADSREQQIPSMSKSQSTGSGSSNTRSSAGKTTSKTAGKGYTTYNYTKCHSGNHHVWSIRRPDDDSLFEIWAGGSSRDGSPLRGKGTPFDLLFGPNSIVSAYRTSSYPSHWKTAAWTRQVNVLGIPWPDFDTPGVGKDFWQALKDDLLEQKEIERMLIMCQGGHGRTGTALAILTALLLPSRHETVDAYVAELRDRYCEKIVESRSQLLYVEEITGKPWKGTVRGAKSRITYDYDYQWQKYDATEGSTKSSTKSSKRTSVTGARGPKAKAIEEGEWIFGEVADLDSGWMEWLAMDLSLLRDHCPQDYPREITKANTGERWHPLLHVCEEGQLRIETSITGIAVYASGYKNTYADLRDLEADLGLTDEDLLRYYHDRDYAEVIPATDLSDLD